MTNFLAIFKPSKTSSGPALLVSLLVLMAGLAGCGTTNTIFYPNERATKAADSVIDDILVQPVVPSKPPAVVPTSPSKPDAGRQ